MTAEDIAFILRVDATIKALARTADCPEAIAQWATFGEREDNWFQQMHDSDKARAERNGGQRDG